MPYHNYVALSYPVLLQVVRYYDTVLPLPCDRLLTCTVLQPSACWDKLQPFETINSKSGCWTWMDGWMKHSHIWLLVHSFLSFTNEGCCWRGCYTCWLSICMLCRRFFIDLNHVMVLKLVNVLVCDMSGDAISCLEAVIEIW